MSKPYLLSAAVLAANLTLCAQTPEPAPTPRAASLNPDLSAIVDLYFHEDDSREGIARLLDEMPGFGHAHGDHDHDHDAVEDGFNLRHLELQMSASVDPWFKGNAIAGISEDDAEMEVAEIETTGLPYGLKIKAGKFYSDFGYINAKHAHQWDFTDQPLVYNLTLGEHGLNDKGAQLSWLAPVPFYLLAGVEAFQGENEKMFDYHGEAPLPEEEGPRVWVGWIKCSPLLQGRHAAQFGGSVGTGVHQEEHEGDGDGAADHGFDGDSRFFGLDAIYKYDAPLAYGENDWILQGEYFNRRKDLDLVANDLAPDLAGQSRQDDQDGYYVQCVYGFRPRWRSGLRWEQVGLVNDTDPPDGSSESYGDSWRLGGMVDFSPSEFSRLRLQANRGRYETEEGPEDAFEVYVQLVVSIGAHGAHTF